MESVCVFCGSSPGRDPRFVAAAEALGIAVASRGMRLVYGGARVGLMGAVADAALATSGAVTGVIPRHIAEWGVVHRGLADLRVVESMHERKALMAALSDGFVALPGGLGTLEEFLEIWTWGQLGLHRKPYGMLNAGGFFDPLLGFLDRQVAQGFLREEHRSMLLVDDDPGSLIDRMGAYVPAIVPKLVGAAGSGTLDDDV